MYYDLNQSNSLFVVIDFQTKLLKIMDKNVCSKTTNNINLCLHVAKSLDIPSVATEHCFKSLGPTDPSIKLNSNTLVVQKTAFSCAGSSEFLSAISKKSHIILTGIEAHICVLETAIELKKLNLI